jgi:type II secretory pathway component PulJ
MKRTRDRVRSAFTLPEAMAAVVLLAFITASVWTVLERCSIAAVNTTQQMRAFEVARENMESLLVLDTVEETTEYGISEKHPDIQWETTVESFTDPATSSMWVQAVCKAEYLDAAGEVQSVELTHWLTALSQQQMDKLKSQEDELEEFIIETEVEAADYAGVEVDDIRQWVADGMCMTESGFYLIPWLDLYEATDGKPSNLDKQQLLLDYPELVGVCSSAPTTPSPPVGDDSDADDDPTLEPPGPGPEPPQLPE